MYATWTNFMLKLNYTKVYISTNIQEWPKGFFFGHCWQSLKIFIQIPKIRTPRNIHLPIRSYPLFHRAFSFAPQSPCTGPKKLSKHCHYWAMKYIINCCSSFQPNLGLKPESYCSVGWWSAPGAEASQANQSDLLPVFFKPFHILPIVLLFQALTSSSWKFSFVA